MRPGFLFGGLFPRAAPASTRRADALFSRP